MQTVRIQKNVYGQTMDNLKITSERQWTKNGQAL